MFQTLTPNVMVEDIAASIRFYTDVLGFSLVATAPEQAPFDWAWVKRDNVGMMLQTRASLAPAWPAWATAPTGGTLALYVQITELPALYAQIKGQVEITEDLHTTFYGAREFSCKDCNGYILSFAEDVAAPPA